MNKSRLQMSESLVLAMILAIGGGFRDSYSFICRGGVFANAQTGNLVLFSQAIAKGELHLALKYVYPILAFIVGVYVTDLIKLRYKNNKKIHWRQIIVIIEVLMLIAVGYIPKEMDHLANVIISLACSMQVESFRNFMGLPMATTMCTGNMRSATALVSSYSINRDPRKLKQSGYYYFVIIMFCIGSALGAVLGENMGIQSIWVDSVIMVLAFILMFKEESSFYKYKS